MTTSPKLPSMKKDTYRETEGRRGLDEREYEEGLLRWTRLPKSGQRCPHTGLSRSAINELILGDSPAVESIVLRKPGKIRGVRLIRVRSLIMHLERLAQEQRDETEGSR